MLASAVAIAALMLGTWLVSLAVRDASIVDIVWGLGFVIVAWVSFAVADGSTARRRRSTWRDCTASGLSRASVRR